MLTSSVVTPCDVPRPEALPAEDVLGEDGASEHSGEVQCDDGGHGDERIAQHVADQHPAPAQPLGPGQTNVVGVEGLNHGRALIDGPGRVGDQDQGQRGQGGMAGVVGESAEEGAAQRRALLAVGVEDGAPRMLIDGDGHELLEGEAEHEDRRGQEHEVRHGDRVVGQLVLLYGRPHAEAHRDEDGHEWWRRSPCAASRRGATRAAGRRADPWSCCRGCPESRWRTRSSSAATAGRSGGAGARGRRSSSAGCAGWPGGARAGRPRC